MVLDGKIRESEQALSRFLSFRWSRRAKSKFQSILHNRYFPPSFSSSGQLPTGKRHRGKVGQCSIKAQPQASRRPVPNHHISYIKNVIVPIKTYGACRANEPPKKTVSGFVFPFQQLTKIFNAFFFVDVLYILTSSLSFQKKSPFFFDSST